jgi:DNA-binding transcriptional ArsR family regulator
MGSASDHAEIMSASDSLFRALGDPTRRALFERLSNEGELSVGALTSGSGVSQPMVSRHLVVLKQAGLVSDRRSGRETRYVAKPDGLEPLAGWMARYGRFWNESMDRLEQLLARMDN